MSHATQNAQNANLRPHAAAALSSLHVDVAVLCEAQDAALMQIMSVARTADAALCGEAEDSVDNVSHALAAIAKIAALAAAQLDAARIEIEDARLHAAARKDAAGGVSLFGQVARDTLVELAPFIVPPPPYGLRPRARARGLRLL